MGFKPRGRHRVMKNGQAFNEGEGPMHFRQALARAAERSLKLDDHVYVSIGPNSRKIWVRVTTHE